ncbi:hypothetical protein JHK87_001087 [Glycine soja]|nr:hypothetical protein JHK87_001087 [Glycine soja]
MDLLYNGRWLPSMPALKIKALSDHAISSSRKMTFIMEMKYTPPLYKEEFTEKHHREKVLPNSVRTFGAYSGVKRFFFPLTSNLLMATTSGSSATVDHGKRPQGQESTILGMLATSEPSKRKLGLCGKSLALGIEVHRTTRTNANARLHPFVDGIIKAQLPVEWKKLINIECYDGLLDSNEHLGAFVTLMNLYTNDDIIMFRVLLTTLKRVALQADPTTKL